MDKKILFVMLFAILLIVPTVSALELNPFADTKLFEKTITPDMDVFLKENFNTDYGVIRVSKTFLWFKSDRIAEYSLTDNTESCLIDCEANGKAILYNDGTLFDDTIYKSRSGKEVAINSQYYIKEIEEYVVETPIYETNCEDIVNKNGTTQTCTDELIRTDKETKTREIWNEYNGEILKAGKYEWKLKGSKDASQSVDFIPIKSKEFSEWAWWNNDWKYKRLINLTANVGNFSYLYQVNYSENMQEDYDDLIFTNKAGTEELNFTIQSYNTTSAIVRIFSQGETEIYMYYGNPSATSASSASNTHFNPVAYYYLDEASGTTAYDALGNYNGANNGATVNQAGKIGKAYSFDGTNDNININGAIGESNSQLSVSMWINADSLDAYKSFIGKGQTTIQNQRFYVGLGNNGTEINFGVATGSNTYGTTSTGVLTTASWYHIVAVFDGTQTGNSNRAKIYINGVEQTLTFTGTIPSTTTASTYNEFIGSEQSAGGFFDGKIDEVGIWDKALTPEQIYQLYTYTAPTYTIGEEEFNEGVIITLNSPADDLQSTSSNINFNATITPKDATIKNVTLYLNGEEYLDLYDTNETINYFKILSLDDGNYTWNITACWEGLSTEEYCTQSETRNFILDTTKPAISIVNASNIVTLTLPINSTINISASDTHLGSCWYYTSDDPTNNTETCNTYFNIEWATGGSKTIYAFANDTFGNVNSTTASINIYDFNYTQTGSATAGEGTSQTFTLLVNSTSYAIGDASATLWYNGVNYAPTTKTAVGTNGYYFSKTFTIPSGTGNSTGKAVNWYWNYNTTQLTTRNTTTQQQTVYNISISDCAVVGGKTILALNLKDEQLNTFVNTTTPNTANIEVDLTVSSLVDGSQTWSFSKQWATNNASVCVPNGLLNSSSYKIDFTIGYDASDHVREFFYIDNGTLDNTNYFNSYTDNEIDLYDLLSADSTTFLFEFTDQDNQEVDEIIVHTFRKYIGEGLFREVERSKQDNAGQTHMHLVEEDVIYYFMITQYGNIIYTSDTYNAKCLSSPCEITLSASSTATNWSVIDNEGGNYAITADKDTRIVTTSFSLDTISTINSSVYRFLNGTSYLINSSTLTATSGSMDIFIPLAYDNSTFYVAFFKDGEFIKSQWISLSESARDYFGTLGAILGGLIVLAMMLMAVSEGAGFIIFTALALIIVVIMQLVDLSWLAIISIICAGGIIVFKLINRRGSRQ